MAFGRILIGPRTRLIRGNTSLHYQNVQTTEQQSTGHNNYLKPEHREQHFRKDASRQCFTPDNYLRDAVGHGLIFGGNRQVEKYGATGTHSQARGLTSARLVCPHHRPCSAVLSKSFTSTFVMNETDSHTHLMCTYHPLHTCTSAPFVKQQKRFYATGMVWDRAK